MRAGPRVTLNSAEKRVLHPADAWGDAKGGKCVDVITGLERDRAVAPGRGGGLPLRPDTIVGRTRPW